MTLSNVITTSGLTTLVHGQKGHVPNIILAHIDFRKSLDNFSLMSQAIYSISWIFFVDRGFRDSLVYLEELGIKAEIPSFMEKGEKQMTTDAANMSRLVTKVIFKSLIDIHVGKMNFLFPFY